MDRGEKEEGELMQQDLTIVEPQAVEVAPRNMSVAMLDVIARAASDSGVDVAKMQQLLEMQERIMAKQAEAEYNAAMSRLQPRLPRVTKAGKIEHNGKLISRYAKYEDIDKAIRPLLCEEGFSISFGTAPLEKGGLIITATISHTAGHSRTESMPLPFDASGAKNSVQAVGSTMQYGKRYLVCAMLNIIAEGEDNDAHALNFIGADEQQTIRDLIHQAGMNPDAVAKFLKILGFESIETIHNAAYPIAVNLLQAKGRAT